MTGWGQLAQPVAPIQMPHKNAPYLTLKSVLVQVVSCFREMNALIPMNVVVLIKLESSMRYTICFSLHYSLFILNILHQPQAA